MAGLSEFYSGPMLSPDRVGNRLVQSQVYGQPSTLAQIYAGILPSPVRADPVGDGLAGIGGWNQFDDQFNSGPSIPHARGTIMTAKAQDRLPSGNMLAFGSPAGPRSPALAAIDHATVPGSAFNGGWGSSALSSMFGDEINPAGTGAVSTTDPWASTRMGPAAVVRTPGLVTGAAPPPPTPIQSLAAMFKPAPVMSGTGPRGTPGAGTIYNNPVKYGATQQARNASMDQHQSFLRSWNSG